jgi:chromosome segregation ATPase
LQKARGRLDALSEKISRFESYDLTQEQNKRRKLIQTEKRNAKLLGVFGRLFSLEKKIQEMQAVEHQYQNFDMQKAQTEQQAEQDNVDQLEVAVDEAKSECEKLTAELNVLISSYRELETKVSTCEERKKCAEKFVEQLSKAENSYERLLIHEDCEREMGDGNPQNIIHSMQKEIKKHKRNLEKLNERIYGEILRKRRKIETIVIDGNNLCYVNKKEDKKFVGISPVVELTRRLVRDNLHVVVIFDPEIPYLLKKDKLFIESQFEDDVEVHISKNKADKIVLKLAETSTAWVISRDEYSDYPDEKAVLEKRIFRPELVDEKLFVHELDVCIKFSSDEC